MHSLYAMKENGQGGASRLEFCVDAVERNAKQYGIFWTVHEFNGDRKKENLVQLNGFAVDIDCEDKNEALEKIKRGLYPTWLIETKRGYHVYWLFTRPIMTSYSEEIEREYRAMLLNRIIPFYDADKKAADISRLLRAPYFMHWKDPKAPYLVKPVAENGVTYTWEQIERFFPDKVADQTFLEQRRAATKIVKLSRHDGKNLFDKIYKMNCKDALTQLSGHASVGGDVFTFRKTTGNNFNIFSNGKGTSCWIDRDGHIGSLDKGGPTIWQWLYWYSHDHKKVYQTMREVFGV